MKSLIPTLCRSGQIRDYTIEHKRMPCFSQIPDEIIVVFYECATGKSKNIQFLVFWENIWTVRGLELTLGHTSTVPSHPRYRLIRLKQITWNAVKACKSVQWRQWRLFWVRWNNFAGKTLAVQVLKLSSLHWDRPYIWKSIRSHLKPPSCSLMFPGSFIS